ncbi:MAG: hypothetical protein M0042_09635 [Nitrospiraceae bacterium]|nr:hypothetical protein [Nitrospiraceae bacterium]
MKIELSKTEFRDLLDLLYIADWVLTAHHDEDEPDNERYLALLQKVYGLAEREGFGALVERSSDGTRLFPTAELEEHSEASSRIDAFTDSSFWDELMYRLAERDAANQAGGWDQLRAMSAEERAKIEEPIEERYVKEFTEHGLDNIAVVERFDRGNGTSVSTSD